MIGPLKLLSAGAAAVAMAALVFGAARVIAGPARAQDDASQSPPAAAQRTVYGFEFVGIDGAPLPLSRFRGQVMLIVNTASRCGFTYQYEGLQTIWDARRDQNFVLIGAPSDAFRQELATADAVREFCEVNFQIDFPMTEIVSVVGPNAHPFFAFAAEQAGAPTWNFNKYLVDQEGRIVRRYGSTASPEEIGRDIDALLSRTEPS